MNSPSRLRLTIYASLFAALTAAGAFLAIPIGPVPIVLQNFFVFLTGLLLGPRWGSASVAVYLLAGALGLPVFAGGTGGIGRFVGPTGGYLIGYLPAVWVIGWIAQTGRHRLLYDLSSDEYDVAQGESVEATLEFQRPVCIEEMSDHPKLARFVMRESNRIVACGRCRAVIN